MSAPATQTWFGTRKNKNLWLFGKWSLQWCCVMIPPFWDPGNRWLHITAVLPAPAAGWRWSTIERGGGVIHANQRIYIYKEYKANSPRLPTGDIYPRKQEAVKKTTSEILSAVLRSLLCGVCVYLTCILCTLYSVHCTVGWVIFALFFKFYAKSCCLLFS